MKIEIGGFYILVTLLLIVLKITGTVSWSWLWVLCPLWIPLALVYIVTMLCCLVGFGLLGFAIISEVKNWFK